MNLRDVFEVFCNRGSTTFRGVKQVKVGGMDAKTWRRMLKDSHVYKSSAQLANGCLIFSEVTAGSRLLEFNQFEAALAKVGERKGMTGSDIAAFLKHHAQEFHQQSGNANSGTNDMSMEGMKEVMKKKAAEIEEAKRHVPKATKAPASVNTKSKKAIAVANTVAERAADMLRKSAPAKALAISEGIGMGIVANKKMASSTAPPVSDLPAAAAAVPRFSFEEEESDKPTGPNLKEIARQNQALDAQMAILNEMNAQLRSGATVPEESLAATGFTWDKKEKHSVVLPENAASWGWMPAEGDASRKKGGDEGGPKKHR